MEHDGADIEIYLNVFRIEYKADSIIGPSTLSDDEKKIYIERSKEKFLSMAFM